MQSSCYSCMHSLNQPPTNPLYQPPTARPIFGLSPKKPSGSIKLMDDYSWTTGNDSTLTCLGKIDSGACGDVYKVSPVMFVLKTRSFRTVIAIWYCPALGFTHHNIMTLLIGIAVRQETHKARKLRHPRGYRQ